MKEFTLERSPMCVSNVGEPFLTGVIVKDINKLTLVRNPMYANNVGEPFLIPVPFTDMEELTLERIPQCQLCEGLKHTRLSANITIYTEEG
jgi:hypothetical protein